MKQKEKLLSIDTTGKIGKVCLNTECITWEAFGNTEVVLRKIDQLLKKHRLKISDLQSITVNPGPGSFTGTRVGVAVANALNWSRGKGVLVRPRYSTAPKISRPDRVRVPR